MYKSALYHALIALIMQFLIALGMNVTLGTDWSSALFAGGTAACTAYLFREVAQHEYKGGGPKVVPPWYGFVNHWNLDSILDLAFPVVATLSTWGIHRYFLG